MVKISDALLHSCIMFRSGADAHYLDKDGRPV
jgi:hypothetical protein